MAFEIFGGSEYWVSGSSVGSGANPSSDLDSLGVLRVGAGYGNTGSQRWFGYMTEFLIFREQTSESDIISIHEDQGSFYSL